MDVYDEEILGFWKLLSKYKVKYILVGGFATNLHGFHRTTADADLWLKDTKTNRKNLARSLAEAGADEIPNIETTQLIPGFTSVKLKSGFDIDIMTFIKGFPSKRFDECFKISSKAIIEKVEVRFLNLNHLIEAKKASGRPKDLLDLIELKKIRNKK